MDSCASIADRVSTLELPNGVRVYLLENHANTTVDVVGLLEGGLGREDSEQAGVANLAISMLDRGTRRRDHAQIATTLESNGALLRYGLLQECMVLRGRCLSEDLEMLLELAGETLCEPTFPEDQIRLVKEDALVGLREAMFDTLDRAQRRATGLLLGSQHPYARHPLGDEAVIESLRRSDLQHYHTRTSVGRDMSLAVVGDIDPQRVRALLEEHLGKLPGGEASEVVPHEGAAGEADSRRKAAGEAALQQDAGNTASAGGVVREHVEIPEKGQVDLIFMRPGVARTDPGFEAYGLANFILGGSFISRLNLQLRDREGLTYGAHSLIASGLQPGVWFASTGVAPADVERAVDGVLREIRRLAEEGVGEEELEMARQHLTGSFPIRLEANRVVASVLLDSVRSGRGLDYIDRYTERIRGISCAQVNAAARQLFATDSIVIVSAGTLAGG